MLGANLGGAIVPFVALSGSAVAARRVVLGNLLIRAAGVVAGHSLHRRCLANAMAPLSVDPARLAVNFHLAFNLALAVVAMPLLGYVATLARGCFPSRLRQVADRRTPRHLDPSVLDTPSEALACAMRETLADGRSSCSIC